MTNYPDRKLIQMLKSSQPSLVDEALRQILDQYEDALIKLLKNKSNSIEDAEEIFHESTLALVLNAKKGLLDEDKTSIKPYLIKTCNNKSITRWKKKRDFEDFEKTEVQNAVSDLDTLRDLFKEEKKEWLENLLEKQGKKCQEILRRVYWYGQRMKEIAEDMDFSSEQVLRNKKSKCMSGLRGILGLGDSPFS